MREDDASTLISILNTLNVHVRLLKVPELGGYLNLTEIFVGPGCLALEEYFETQYFNISLISNSILELDKWWRVSDGDTFFKKWPVTWKTAEFHNDLKWDM